MYIHGRPTTRGICHLCQQAADCDYCQMCQHWFCAVCIGKYAGRMMAAAKALIQTPVSPCCGPDRLKQEASRAV